MPKSALSRVRVQAHYKVRGRDLDLPKYPHPGKFEGDIRISEPIWDLTLEGGEGLGDVQDFGAYFSSIELGPDAVDDVARQARENGFELTRDERLFIASQAGAIVEEDSLGFVSVGYYENKADLDGDWEKIERDYERFLEEQEEEEQEYEDHDDDAGYLTPGDDPTMPGGGPPVYHGPEERFGG